MRYFSLFSGIGGFELGFPRSWENVGHSEIDKYAAWIYRKHFPDARNYGDATEIKARELPEFDLLVAGFPCQAFSVAGKKRGFKDDRGNLFFEIARIAEFKKPRYLLLENVEGLLFLSKGKMFARVIETLYGLGYDLQWQLLNSRNFGIPHHRKRLFIIGHLRKIPRPEIFPIVDQMYNVFHGDNGGQEDVLCWRNTPYRFSMRLNVSVTLVSQFTEIIIYEQVGDNEQDKIERHQDGIGGEEIPVGRRAQVQKTLRAGEDRHSVSGGEGGDIPGQLLLARMPASFQNAENKQKILAGKGGKKPAKRQRDNKGFKKARLESTKSLGTRSPKEELANLFDKKIRRLTPVEWERLQGFPDNWTRTGMTEEGETVEISDAQRYKCLGNAVTVPVIRAIARRLHREAKSAL